MAETANTSGAAMQAPGWRRLLRQIDRNGERWLLLIFYTTIVVTITMEVIRRFVLSYSSIWGEEIARYAFIYLVWIGASAAVRERAHIRIDVLFHYVSERVQAMLYLFAEVLTLIVAVIALYWSLETVFTSIRFGSVTHGLRISQAWFTAAVPLGFSMMVFRLLQSMARDWRTLKGEAPLFRGFRLFD